MYDGDKCYGENESREEEEQIHFKEGEVQF